MTNLNFNDFDDACCCHCGKPIDLNEPDAGVTFILAWPVFNYHQECLEVYTGVQRFNIQHVFTNPSGAIEAEIARRDSKRV